MTYTKEQLTEILKLHNEWVRDDSEGKRANLRHADLCGANLRHAELCGANLRHAELCGADLCGANLRDADLRGANLRDADLCGADLRGANLRHADLRHADLRDANLRHADLCGSSVCRMDFGGWSICIYHDKTSIGCQTHPNTDWLKWKPEDVSGMHHHASVWWKTHGPAIKAAIKVVMKKHKEMEETK